jgi:hypothetical protein
LTAAIHWRNAIGGFERHAPFVPPLDFMEIPQDSVSAFVLGLCCGINADHKITNAEAKAFIEIMRHEPALLGAPILSRHRPALEHLTTHDEMWHTHLRQAEEVICAVLGVTKPTKAEIVAEAPALVFDTPQPGETVFAGVGFVFTGEFLMGRTQAEEVAEKLGAVIQGSTTGAKGCVVVGSIPSPAWKFGKFGTKVSRAMELRDGGSGIRIISEETYCHALPADTLEAATKSTPSLRVEGFRVISGGTDLG